VDDTERNRRLIEKHFTWRERYGTSSEPESDQYSPEAKARLREQMEQRFPFLARLLREVEPPKK
jgi:hypothetical protein